jgi:hypothetical protein
LADEVAVKPDKRDPATGRFVKGNPIRPINPSGGRPKKLDSKKMLEAIHDEFQPHEIGAMLRQAHQIAVKNDDWKGVLEVARLIAAYAIGKPVQRSIKATIEPEDFAKFFKGESPPEEIEGDYEVDDEQA